SCGTSTASTSGVWSWGKSWQRNFYTNERQRNGPGNLQPQHPQVPQDGRGQLAARDRAGRPEGDGKQETGRQRDPAGARDAGDSLARPQSALPRRDQTKIEA